MNLARRRTGVLDLLLPRALYECISGTVVLAQFNVPIIVRQKTQRVLDGASKRLQTTCIYDGDRKL